MMHTAIESRMSWVVVGEMRDETISLRTRTGRLLRLRRDLPPSQRARVFADAFAETNGSEASGRPGRAEARLIPCPA